MPPSTTVLGVPPVPEHAPSLAGSDERASLPEIELRLKDLLSRKAPVRRLVRSRGGKSQHACAAGAASNKRGAMPPAAAEPLRLGGAGRARRSAISRRSASCGRGR